MCLRDISEPELGTQVLLTTNPAFSDFSKCAPLSYLQLMVCLRMIFNFYLLAHDRLALFVVTHLLWWSVCKSPELSISAIFNFCNLPLCIWENRNQDNFKFFKIKSRQDLRALTPPIISPLCARGCDCFCGVVRLVVLVGYCGEEIPEIAQHHFWTSRVWFLWGGFEEKRGSPKSWVMSPVGLCVSTHTLKSLDALLGKGSLPTCCQEVQAGSPASFSFNNFLLTLLPYCFIMLWFFNEARGLGSPTRIEPTHFLHWRS